MSIFFQRAITQKRGIILSRKKIRVSYFLMRNPYMKFQNSSIHGSEVMLCIKKRDERTGGRTEGRTDEQPRSNMPSQLLWSWGHKKVKEKSRECNNHKPQPYPDIKRKRKPINPNKHKSIKHTKSTKISSLFPKRGNRSAIRTEKHKNKMAQGKTYNKAPRRINHKAPKSKTNTGTTALERSVE